jgi:hypothetical protein
MLSVWFLSISRAKNNDDIYVVVSFFLFFFMGPTGKVGPGLRGLYREEGSVSRLSPYLIWISAAMRKLDNLCTTLHTVYIRCLIHGFTFKLHGKYLKF